MNKIAAALILLFACSGNAASLEITSKVQSISCVLWVNGSPLRIDAKPIPRDPGQTSAAIQLVTSWNSLIQRSVKSVDRVTRITFEPNTSSYEIFVQANRYGGASTYIFKNSGDGDYLAKDSAGTNQSSGALQHCSVRGDWQN